ncbi:ribonuclease H-like domain-containing protein [Aspergillus affinis]|uniref:ribonuclease H-like domain-containing protein n=1 Tax=Aspergillus affinis TaxID=1070780 RepID=UPI0022FE46D0|nr:ribonuclease H-like domain-containing protein [Aspergillus affinis]KAI9041813.1 ribonuclease H-like domain-containing protein [Aspergillus affinis]
MVLFSPPSPLELSNGCLVCAPHGLVVCPDCTVDFSFMEDFVDECEDEDEDDISPGKDFDEDSTIEELPPRARISSPPRVGTGRVLPTRFRPPSTHATPQSLFPPTIGRRSSPAVCRFINATNPRQFLIYTDGACLDNGGANPRAGWSFVFKPSTEDRPGYVRQPLETKGPSGEAYGQTSNRAELRAVIAALGFRAWPGEGCNNLVIATDSEYVVEGVISWVRGWIRRGWMTRMGTAVKNRDLWECLLGEIERWHEQGLDVAFWRVPREWNTDADHHARHAASQERIEDFQEVCGLFV